MPIIPDHVLEQVRQANPVEEIIGAHFPLKRRGANLITLCPFHREKTPSFNVNPSKQIWHCFGCGAGGDVFKFVMQYENLPFVDAVQRLAERAGIRIEFDAGSGGPSRDAKETLLSLHEQVAAYFHQHLLQQPSDSPVQAYLKKRQIKSETVKRWRLGYSPEGWDTLIQWGRAKKFSPALLESAGLALPRDGGGHYDRFRGRLMFCICDEQGRVVGFSGRILTNDKDQPKYVNSPETAIFQKGKILFALDKAKRSILDDQLAIVCEGQLDTITCHEAGFTNVVAPQGTAFTEQHARILKRHTDQIVLMFDSDEAGQKAAARNAEPLWDLGVSIRVALLPAGHDPDSFLKANGADALRALLANAPGFFDFLLQRLSTQFDPRTERGKMQIAEQMVPWLCRIREPILQATFAQRTATRLDVREEVVRQAMKEFARRGPRPREDDPEPPVVEPDDELPAGQAAEQMLLQLMLGDERIIEVVGERLDQHWLSRSLAAEMLVRVLDLHSRAAWNGPSSLLNEQADDPHSRLLSALLLQPAPPSDVAHVATDCLTALERAWLERELGDCRRQLATPGLAVEQMTSLQQQFLDMDKRRRALTLKP